MWGKLKYSTGGLRCNCRALCLVLANGATRPLQTITDYLCLLLFKMDKDGFR